jgi:DegV family protein with EDD domain
MTRIDDQGEDMQIVTDSAADLTASEIKDWGIEVVPLSIQFPEGEVLASEISADDFYDRLKAMAPAAPSTSQPSVGTLLGFYEKARTTSTPVMSIHVSSGLSGTYSTAVLASKQAADVDVTLVDTQTLSCGQRFQVLAAAMALKAGWDTPRILKRLEEIRANTEVAYTLETLEYLARGGRIGRVQAIAGSILQIKPIITVDKQDGKYTTLDRKRTVGQAITAMADYFAKKAGASEPVWVTVVHGKYADKAETMANELRAKMNVAKFDLLRISPVLGVHTGPGVVGAAVVPMRYFNDLL